MSNIFLDFISSGIWVVSLSGLISFVSSAAIIYMMLSDRERKLSNQPNNRFLLMMSVMDLLQAIGFMTTTLPLPGDSGMYGAIGNNVTCSIQAFFLQLGFCVPLYNSSLCIWFLMNIKYNMQPKQFRQRIEPYCHLVSIGVPWIRAIVCAALGAYGPMGRLCTGLPSFFFLVIVMYGLILGVAMVTLVYCLAAIYISFAMKEKKMRRYSTSSSGMLWRPSTFLQGRKQAAQQGLLYSFAFFITYFFVLFNFFSGGKYRVVRVLGNILYPLQGFWNFILYTRKSITRIRQEYPELYFHMVLWKLVFRPDEVKSKRTVRRFSAKSTTACLRQSVISTNVGSPPVLTSLRTPTAARKSIRRTSKEKSKKDISDVDADADPELPHCLSISKRSGDHDAFSEETKEEIQPNDVIVHSIHKDIEEALAQMKEEGLEIFSGSEEGNACNSCEELLL